MAKFQGEKASEDGARSLLQVKMLLMLEGSQGNKMSLWKGREKEVQCNPQKDAVASHHHHHHHKHLPNDLEFYP